MLLWAVIFMVLAIIFYLVCASVDGKNALGPWVVGSIFLAISACLFLEAGRGQAVGLDRLDENMVYRYLSSAPLEKDGLAVVLAEPSGSVVTIICDKDHLKVDRSCLVQLVNGDLVKAIDGIVREKLGSSTELPAQKDQAGAEKPEEDYIVIDVPEGVIPPGMIEQGKKVPAPADK